MNTDKLGKALVVISLILIAYLAIAQPKPSQSRQQPESVLKNATDVVFENASGENNYPAILKDVKRLQVGSLGEGSEVIQEKLRLRLAKSGRYQVAENVGDADAILTGVIAIEGRQILFAGHSNTVYTGTGVVKLIDPASKRTLWIYEYKPRRFRDHDAATDVANRVVERLVKDGSK